MYPPQGRPPPSPSPTPQSNAFVWIVIGVVGFFFLLLVVAGAGLGFFAFRSKSASKAAGKPDSAESIAKARESCTINDCEESHAIVSILPSDSPLRQSSDVRTIESTWATMEMNKAKAEPDPAVKAAYLTRVQTAELVPQDQRDEAATMLAALSSANNNNTSSGSAWGRDPLPLPGDDDAGLSWGVIGTNDGADGGIGDGRSGHVNWPHPTRAPSLRMGATQVNGRLPPEVIQRIVRQQFGRFRLCYENGLRTNPNLMGRVTVKFVIDRAGSVPSAQDGGSDLPDKSVVACVVKGFSNLSFPQPEGGIVIVVFPIIFSPGD